MKRFLVLLSLFGACTLMAQSTNAPTATATTTNTTAAVASGSLEAELGTLNHPVLTLNQAKPNEIIRGGKSYSGIAVEAAKKRNVLQLINPLAPPQYGSPEDNVVRDPINGHVEGLKIFAFRF